VASAAWHMAHAAMMNPDEGNTAELALALADKLRCEFKGYGEGVETLRALVAKPEPPGGTLVTRDLHRKLDATHSAMEVLHQRLAAAGVGASDEGRWDTMVDALGLMVQRQRALHGLLNSNGAAGTETS
jgi:hypothetical protein